MPFLDAHPAFRLDLRLSDTEFDLIEGSFDLAPRNMVMEDKSLKGRKLADDPWILCAAPSYTKAAGAPHHPDDLAQHKLIAFKDRAPRALIGPDGETAGFDPLRANGRLILDDGLSQKIATVNGAEISVNSVWSVKRELDSGALVRVLPEWSTEAHAALWHDYPDPNRQHVCFRVIM
ncbi:MAG: substrate binding domain-containing protein, partial [Pseudomonadota bacterium]